MGDQRRGLAFGVAAYVLWGMFPLYWPLLEPAGAVEILAHRILWTLAVCALVLLVTRDVRWLLALARTPRRLGGVMLAGLTVMILVVDVLLAVCRLMVRAGVVGVLVVVVGVALAAGVLGAVIGMVRVLPGMACVFLVCR